ncbi:MAG: hypothetical protein RIR26_1576 [Pseudomonadota bacterium]|jgi:hypothetical protein
MRAIFRAIPLAFIVSVLSLGCSKAPKITREKVQEAWDGYNNPAQLDSGAVVQFELLPLAGMASTLPWADIYWPSYMGGIALRWVNGAEPPFSAIRPTADQVAAMSFAQLASLSPAEKYDIFMGRFDYPTVQAELARTHPGMPQWAGLCHGWSAATMNFDEPNAVTLTGASGVSVPFGSADIKALLAYAQGVVFMPPARVLGQRCNANLDNFPHLSTSPECRDTNAGAFHLVLANHIGRSGLKLIADLTRGDEVWNFPVYGYRSREIGRRPPQPGAALQTAVEVLVETEIDFIAEIEAPNWNPLVDSRNASGQKAVYQYALEIDSLGRIVGGSWLTEDRPDFLWLQERPDFRGYYGSIESIYESSVGNPSLPSTVVTPVPTLSPLPTPSPVPTLAPLPTPAPVPTLAPLPLPSVDPNQPIGPVLTQPVPPAVPAEPPFVSLPVSAMISCPIGSQPDWRGYVYCTDGTRTFAPVTEAMRQLCLSSGAMGCHESLWSNELYASLRGNSDCPFGAAWNPTLSACVESTNVLGPFSHAFTAACVAKGFGNLCYSLQMDINYYNLVVSQ